jgi:transposase-like protein
MMQKLTPTHFKLNYQYREYHLAPEQIEHSKPKSSRVDLFKIHNSDNVLGLVLAFYVSFAMSAKKTALLLRMVFGIQISYQTVLNYAEAAAYHCHDFNLKNKGPIDSVTCADETYIKVKGKHHYVWFCVSFERRTITSYHVADNRNTVPAIATICEAIRTADPDQEITLVTDGNPSYQSALHYINNDKDDDNEDEDVQDSEKKNKIKHITVIGLENLDQESEEYRMYKQIIERLNRTFKMHIKPAAGFNTMNSAMALTALFVTYYNFLRPHMTLNYQVPIKIDELSKLDTIQQKWLKILVMAANG